MDLSQITKNQKAFIKQINAEQTLKKRLFSLGLGIGTEVEVVETSLQKNTLKVALGLSSIALRLDEAKTIQVEVA